MKIFNDISLALGTGKNVVLCLLNLSAAFDTVAFSVDRSSQGDRPLR